MSERANKDLAKRWFEEVWNQGRESAIDELFHPQGKA
jgi:predicted ester cyclase